MKVLIQWIVVMNYTQNNLVIFFLFKQIEKKLSLLSKL